MIYDVLILGGGPAGISAGIYASRNNLKTLLITNNLGGKIGEKAVSIDELNAEYFYLQGNIYKELHKEQKAINAFKKANDLNPEEQDFVFSLSESYVNLKKFDRAIKILSEFLKDNTGNALAYYRLAACYFL